MLGDLKFVMKYSPSRIPSIILILCGLKPPRYQVLGMSHGEDRMDRIIFTTTLLMLLSVRVIKGAVCETEAL